MTSASKWRVPSQESTIQRSSNRVGSMNGKEESTSYRTNVERLKHERLTHPQRSQQLDPAVIAALWQLAQAAKLRQKLLAGHVERAFWVEARDLDIHVVGLNIGYQRPVSRD
jgi:hypothetical protein